MPSLDLPPVHCSKGSPLYLAHFYHTKLPPEGIVPYVNRFSRPGDWLLDPFCGSGMTGVASRLAGRNAVLIDLSPFATFLAHHHCYPPSCDFKRQADSLITELESRYHHLYTTRCRHCSSVARIRRTIWSAMLLCPLCRGTFLLYETLKDNHIRRKFPCPRCGKEITRHACKRIADRPVELHYQCPTCGKHTAPLTRDDLQLALSSSAPPSFLDIAVPERGDEIPRLHRDLITHLSQLFTPRNLTIIHAFRSAIPDNSSLLFLLSSTIARASRLNRYIPHLHSVPGHTLGTMYLPGFQSEENPFLLLRRKLKNILAYSVHFHQRVDHHTEVKIITRSATDLSPIPDGSIDYAFTDPPFGGNISYSELNLLWEAIIGRFTDPTHEAVLSPAQGKDTSTYYQLMKRSFSELHRVLKPDALLTLVFHNTSSEVWQSLFEALCDARFQIIKTSTFHKGRNLSFKQFTASGTVTHDVVLLCRKSKRVIHPQPLSQRELRELLPSVSGLDPRRAYSRLLATALARSKLLPFSYSTLLRLLQKAQH